MKQLHQKFVEIFLSTIKFLKFSSDDALRNFNIPNRFQMILKAQRIVDKDNAIHKVKAKIETLQKEIKELYVLFKPLIEKGFPPFWDENNCLLKKEAYNNFLVQKRNDHSQFENMEGNLKGETIVEKLDDIFDFLGQIRKFKLPPPLIEEYIDLEIEARHLVNIELLRKSQFQEIIKLAVKPVGAILIMQ